MNVEQFFGDQLRIGGKRSNLDNTDASLEWDLVIAVSVFMNDVENNTSCLTLSSVF